MAATALINLSDANAGWGTVSYNGYPFSGLRDFKLTGEVVPDRSGRAAKVTRYVAYIHAYQNDVDNGTHETAMASARVKLEEYGQVLIISGQGLGNIQINGASGATRQDADWGPKPRRVELIPIGGITTEVIFEIEFSIKEGTSAQGNILEYGYSIDRSWDDAGVATRTINGYLQIAQTRPNNAQTPAASADSFWPTILQSIKVPLGMRRTAPRCTLSDDRSKLDWSITDVQLDAEAPPADALRAELDYQIESLPPGFAKFSASLSGSIEVPVGTPVMRAAQAFVAVMLDKFKRLSQAVGQNGVVFPIRVKFGRTLGTRVSNFGIAWMVTGCLDDLLKSGGIWDPISGANYANWAASMQGAWNASAQPNLAYNVTDDAIVDLNTGQIKPITSGGFPELGSSSGSSTFKISIPAGVSWLAYENSLKPYREHQAVAHSPAASYRPGDLSSGNLNDTGVSMATSLSPSDFRTVTQYQGPPIDMVLMTGKALRLQHLPTVPRLATISGQPVQEVKVVTKGPTAIGCFFGATLYSVQWAILYRPTRGYLTKIDAQPNPALCCDIKTGS